jgi:hypothetical protein
MLAKGQLVSLALTWGLLEKPAEKSCRELATLLDGEKRIIPRQRRCFRRLLFC